LYDCIIDGLTYRRGVVFDFKPLLFCLVFDFENGIHGYSGKRQH